MIRRYVAEALGTFAIVFFGCGAIASFGHTGGLVGHIGVNLVFGLVVAASIYALGHISAAHFNPAVSVGFAVAGRFPWRYVGGYVIAQVLGALIASGLHSVLFGDLARAASFGATSTTIDAARCVAVEAILTAFLMLVIISVATDRRANGAVPGLAIGAAVAMCGLFGGPLTGCSMNPARSFAPALFSGGLATVWPYVVGPVLGAAAAAALYEWIRGGDEHAQGAPNDLAVALEKTRISG